MKKIFWLIILTILIAASLTACSVVQESSDNTCENSDFTNSIVDPDPSATNSLSVISDDIISEYDIEAIRKNYNEDKPIIDTRLIDLDFDGEEELLVLTTWARPHVFEVWEKNNGEMELTCRFGAGKLDWIDKISLEQGEIDGKKVYLFSFSMSSGIMTADEVLSVVRETADGYEVEHLLSRGRIDYFDIPEPFIKEFYRKGWSRGDIGMDADYGDITKEEYERLYKEYTGGISVDTSA